MKASTRALGHRAGLRASLVSFAAGAALAAGVALAQATWVVQTLIPESLAIRVPTTEIGFDLGKNYPPASFPVLYPASLPDGTLPVQVFANASGVWSLVLEVPDLKDGRGQLLISARQVQYRVNGGLWLRATGTPQVILTSQGGTNGWQANRIEFRLELLGTEKSGAYKVEANVTAIQQP